MTASTIYLFSLNAPPGARRVTAFPAICSSGQTSHRTADSAPVGKLVQKNGIPFLRKDESGTLPGRQSQKVATGREPVANNDTIMLVAAYVPTVFADNGALA